ncbi:hypothetical protein [Vibrio cortegadensis]|uniref:hypothetical protein n=1 Tax=Vibrio cortegadensis TaxID=1328770 RepID=UPI0021C471CA|nr:hypothetical protein [Vibrio cortegadensis]
MPAASTTPQAEGKDWSDVYITRAICASVSQPNNARGFQTLAKYRYLQSRDSQRFEPPEIRHGYGANQRRFKSSLDRTRSKNSNRFVTVAAGCHCTSINDEKYPVEYYEDPIIKDSGKD